MAKRFKKRIEEVCGLGNLSKDERSSRASKLLDDEESLQNLCRASGVPLREVERTLRAITKESKKSEEVDGLDKVETYSGTKNRPPSRTIQEILASVYGPREH